MLPKNNNNLPPGLIPQSSPLLSAAAISTGPGPFSIAVSSSSSAAVTPHGGGAVGMVHQDEAVYDDRRFVQQQHDVLPHQSSRSTFGDSAPGTPSNFDSDSDTAGGANNGEEVGEDRKKKRRTGFIETLYIMANSPENEPAIGFAADGVSLEIRNTDDLSAIVLPKHFKHRNVSSFIRQLNNYGFRTIPSYKGIFQTFVHDHFLKGRRDLIGNIVRRTNGEVRKKKTLYEQVVEFKQKETDRKRRAEELESRETQRQQYVQTLEHQNRALMDERDALILENQRLMMVLNATSNGALMNGSQSGNPSGNAPSKRRAHSKGVELAVNTSANYGQPQSGVFVQTPPPPPPPPSQPRRVVHTAYEQMPPQQQQQVYQSQFPVQNQQVAAAAAAMGWPPLMFEPVQQQPSQGTSSAAQTPTSNYGGQELGDWFRFG